MQHLKEIQFACLNLRVDALEVSVRHCIQISVDGGYSKFGSWSKCSAECGGGTQTRSRTCTNPAPANGGADCVGASIQERDCNTKGCPGQIEIW